MAAIQLNFTLRTSPKCKTVHLIGSWDNYGGQLPLSKDSNKEGGWKGTFRFQGTTLQPGQRYWYYYIVDGYHVSHDPAREFTVEPTTGRKLNILDIPAKGAAPAAPTTSSKRHSRVQAGAVAKGRSLSPSQIKSPIPSKPYATKAVAGGYDAATLEQLSQQYARQRLADSSSSEEESESEASDSESDSDDASDVPSLTSRSSNSSSPSSVSSTGSCCTCERYAITRSGNRVKLDCGGQRCGYSDASSECSSESEHEVIPAKAGRGQTTRRQGIVVRR